MLTTYASHSDTSLYQFHDYTRPVELSLPCRIADRHDRHPSYRRTVRNRLTRCEMIESWAIHTPLPERIEHMFLRRFTDKSQAQ
jgi:hypothetical protein